MWQDEADLPMLPPCGRCRSHVQLLGAIAAHRFIWLLNVKNQWTSSFPSTSKSWPFRPPCHVRLWLYPIWAKMMTLVMRKYSVHGCVTLFIFFKGLQMYFWTKFPCNLSPSRQKIVGCSFNLSPHWLTQPVEWRASSSTNHHPKVPAVGFSHGAALGVARLLHPQPLRELCPMPALTRDSWVTWNKNMSTSRVAPWHKKKITRQKTIC